MCKCVAAVRHTKPLRKSMEQGQTQISWSTTRGSDPGLLAVTFIPGPLWILDHVPGILVGPGLLHECDDRPSLLSAFPTCLCSLPTVTANLRQIIPACVSQTNLNAGKVVSAWPLCGAPQKRIACVWRGDDAWCGEQRTCVGQRCMLQGAQWRREGPDR